jgi:hypothetical protein
LLPACSCSSELSASVLLLPAGSRFSGSALWFSHYCGVPEYPNCTLRTQAIAAVGVADEESLVALTGHYCGAADEENTAFSIPPYARGAPWRAMICLAMTCRCCAAVQWWT